MYLALIVDTFQARIGIEELEFKWHWGEGKTGVPGEKPLGAEKRTNNPYMTPVAASGNWTRAILVGGERSHHCAIPAPHKNIFSHLAIHSQYVPIMKANQLKVYERGIFSVKIGKGLKLGAEHPRKNFEKSPLPGL